MKLLNRVPLFATPGMVATRLLHPWDSPGKSTGVDCHFLLQGIVLTQGLNPGLLHCRRTLYPLSHQGTPQTVSQSPIQRGGEGPRAEAPPLLAGPSRAVPEAGSTLSPGRRDRIPVGPAGSKPGWLPGPKCPQLFSVLFAGNSRD